MYVSLPGRVAFSTRFAIFAGFFEPYRCWIFMDLNADSQGETATENT